MKKELEKLDFSIPELIISEWNLTISNRNRINDSCGLAAYIVKNCIECTDATMMTSRRSESAAVAEWRRRSISSLMALSFSI